MATKLEIRVIADTRAAMQRVKGLVAGIKNEFKKIGAGAGGPANIDINQLANQIVSAQSKIASSTKKSGSAAEKAGKKGAKAAQDWRRELEKLKVALAQTPGRESRAGIKIISDMNALLTKQVSIESKRKYVRKGELKDLDKSLASVDELTRKRQLQHSQALKENQAKRITLKVDAERRRIMGQIARNATSHLKIQHELRTGTKMVNAETVKLFKSELKFQRSLGKTVQELKEAHKVSVQLEESSRRRAKQGLKTVPGATGATPDVMARRQQTEVATQAVTRGVIRPEDVTNMQQVSRFAADIGKYAQFQIRWFASAGIIFTIASALASATRNTIDFYQALKDIEAITAKSEEEIRFIGDAAKEVASTTPLAAAEAAKMGLKLVQAGLSARAAAEAMKTVAAVTTVAGEDMETVAKAVTTAMFAWNIEASRVPEIGNILAGALNFSRLTVEDLGTAFNYLASTSSIMSRNLAETSAALAVLSNMGMRASTIGTGLSQLMTQLVAPTAKFRQELKRVGISANEVNPTMNKMSAIVTKLSKAGFSASKSMDILGVRAGRILAASIVATGKAFEDMEKKITKQDMLNDALAVSMEGPRNALMRMRNQLEIAIIQIGDVAVPALVGMADVMGFLLQRFRDATAAVSFLTEKFGGLNVALATLGGVTFVLAAKNAVMLGNSIRTLATSTALFAGALNLLKAHPILIGVTVLTAALSALGSMFLANKKKLNQLSLAHDEDAKAKEKSRIAAERLKMEEKALARAVTDLTEAWEALKRPVVTLPFASKAEEVLLYMNKMKVGTAAFNEQIRESSAIIKGLEAGREEARGRGAVGAVQVYNKQIETVKNNLIKAKEEVKAFGLETATSFRKSFTELLAFKPAEMARGVVKGILGRGQVDELDALIKYQRELKSNATAIVNEVKRINEVHVHGTQDAEGFTKKMAAVVQKYKALQQIANKVSISLSKLTNKTKDYTNALIAAEKGAIRLTQQLEDLKTKEPLDKIALKTARQYGEVSLTLLKFEEKRQKIQAKLKGPLGEGVRGELVKQRDALDQIVSFYGDQLGLIVDIGEEMKKQATETITGGAIPGAFTEAAQMIQRLSLQKDYHAELQKNEKENQEEIARIEVAMAEQRFQKNLAFTQGMLSQAGNFANSMMAFARNKANADGKVTQQEEKRMKKVFKMQKAVSISQAMISTYTAATAAMDPVKGVGPVAGPALAAAIIATGLANVAVIASQKFSGGATGGGGGGGAAQGYKYFDIQATKYGTGYRPGEEQGGTHVTYNINAVDAPSFKALVEKDPTIITEVVQQDIKDRGKTKEVIQKYARG